MIHIARPYVAEEDHVFIYDEESDWKHVTVEEAARLGKEAVECYAVGCTKPAVMLDHYFPYDSFCTRCEEHCTVVLEYRG